MAFKDIYPKAPVHVLIVPKRHIASIAELSDDDAEVIGRCFLVARRLGETKGFADKGYRDSVNTGPEGARSCTTSTSTSRRDASAATASRGGPKPSTRA